MIAAERDSIKNFLELLQNTHRGRAMTVNMLDSHSHGLFSISNLRDFLVDCARTYESRTGSSANVASIVEDVSCGHGIGMRSYLRQFPQPMFSATDPQLLANTLKTESFSRFLVDPRYKSASSGLPVALPATPINSPNAILEYESRLAELTSDPAWFSPTATIGRPLPYPSNCWITSNLFGAGRDAPSYGSDRATEARDELGLIDHREGTFLLRLTFRASSVAALSSCQIARPTFSDLGNSRFRVSQSSSRAAEYAAAGWGATVHLGKFGETTFPDATGVSERVSSSLPLSGLSGLAVGFLGRVEGDRGLLPKIDDDEAFAQNLELGRTTQEIREILLSIIE
jgi:hypothetical protein